nr:hypothetical protein [Tanacetum cinerariifolium]
MLQVLAVDQKSVPFVHRTLVVSVLASMETMLYLLHRHHTLPPKETCCSLPPKETCCSLPPEETCCPYLLKRLVASYLLRRLATSYLLRRHYSIIASGPETFHYFGQSSCSYHGKRNTDIPLKVTKVQWLLNVGFVVGFVGIVVGFVGIVVGFVKIIGFLLVLKEFYPEIQVELPSGVVLMKRRWVAIWHRCFNSMRQVFNLESNDRLEPDVQKPRIMSNHMNKKSLKKSHSNIEEEHDALWTLKWVRMGDEVGDVVGLNGRVSWLKWGLKWVRCGDEMVVGLGAKMGDDMEEDVKEDESGHNKERYTFEDDDEDGEFDDLDCSLLNCFIK